jgi:hypothetical protein
MRKFFAAAVIMAALLSSASAINIIGLPQQPVVATGSVTTANGTLNVDAGTLVTPSWTVAAGATGTITLFNNQLHPSSVVSLELYNGSNSQGTPVVTNFVKSEGQIIITVTNAHATLALNGTLKLDFIVIN